ncbi:unnamed protein product [Protopolystoma xenopodis]|uniref:Uncharacterized protein n=1 Tax=Protopolystoma xenopodis TaxID=117903 RepID=A0A448WA83_9PLAT|nr:unnamed protein product [Protopolystoma xenopodis]
MPPTTVLSTSGVISTHIPCTAEAVTESTVQSDDKLIKSLISTDMVSSLDRQLGQYSASEAIPLTSHMVPRQRGHDSLRQFVLRCQQHKWLSNVSMGRRFLLNPFSVDPDPFENYDYSVPNVSDTLNSACVYSDADFESCSKSGEAKWDVILKAQKTRLATNRRIFCAFRGLPQFGLWDAEVGDTESTSDGSSESLSNLTNSEQLVALVASC